MNATAGQAEVKVIPIAGQAQAQVNDDEFLAASDLVPVKREAAERNLRLVLSEIELMTRDKQWADILAAFHPVTDKLPEVADHRLDVRVREKIAFALGHLGKFGEAIAELEVCVQREPDNFHVHSSLAYTAYDSLYAAKNRDIFLSGKIKADRIRLAHEHFKAAQALRPDGVTNFYRQGMLWKQIEGKADRALPLFQRAVANWDKLTAEEKQARHQERKNFVKSLYQVAGCLADGGRPQVALSELKRCLTEDEQSNHLSLVFKYFALGKVNYLLDRFTEARDALLFALRCPAGRSETAHRVYRGLPVGGGDRPPAAGKVGGGVPGALHVGEVLPAPGPDHRRSPGGSELSQREEKILFQTAGFLPRAKTLLHRLLSAQSAYNPHLVDYKISRLRGKPLGCRRIHSLLNFAGDLCRFEQPADYPQPLLHLGQAAGEGDPKAEKVENLAGAFENLRLAITQVERFMK